ncbi:MAG: putative Serine/threonine-protein kinase Nek3 [Streblomastix strix]|uniref:non-specific serine/threonine protein kinase n=1 Tax=Streblomastix strix TaxID=222440 RepID=A0A5J4VSE2_9EUKA|nr:MAG: putative Serine/threonine-protein kinase Nek3 [Streblomastix strix]
MQVRGQRPSATHKWSDYELIRSLTSGAFGRVIQMKQKDNNKQVIIKRIQYINPEEKKTADDEIAMLKLAQSKHIVQFLESFIDGLDICIVMEFCSGGNLRVLIEALKRKAVKERKMMCFRPFYQMLSALAYLHSLGIVHRDLKPENVFLDENGNAKTGDYGLAQKMISKSYLKSAGTEVYAAPEAHTQNKMVFASDIWVLAVIVIEMLTGVHPFAGRNQFETIENIKNGKMVPLPDYIQGELKIMIIKMLNIEADKRPTAQQLLDTDLMQQQAEIERLNEIKEEKMRSELLNNQMNLLNTRINILESEKEREKQQYQILNEGKDQDILKLLEQNQKLKEQNQLLNEENKRLNTELASVGFIPPMNSIIPFSFTFEQYIQQCSVNALKLQEKLFDLKLKGRMICWLAYIVNVQYFVSQIQLFPCDEQVPFNAILHFTPKTQPQGLDQGKQIWIFARLSKFGRNINELELEAVFRPEGLKADLTVTYAKIRDIFNPKAQIMADQLYKTWINTQFSLIAQIINLDELLEDPNYCASLTVNVIQPFHDNELEPVVIFIPKQDIAVLPSINEHLESPFEITITPLASKIFKPQPLPLNFIPNLFKQWENVDLEQNHQPSQPFVPGPQIPISNPK